MKKVGEDRPDGGDEATGWAGAVEVEGTTQPIPRVHFNPGPAYGDAHRSFGIASSIACTPGGRLWCGFSSGGEGEGNLNYGIVVMSDDGGKTWTEPAIVFDTDGDGPIRSDHTTVWVDPRGMLWIFWSQYPEELCGPASSQWAITCAHPDDDVRLWSAPRKLADGQNLLTTPTVLRNGTWVLPTGCWRRGEDHPSRPLLSTDDGATFAPGGPLRVDTAPDFDEYMVAERANGNLVIFNRHPESILQCESRDGGQTWSTQKPNGIRHTNSRFVFLQLKSGAWLLVKHGALDWMSDIPEEKFPQNRGRSHLTAYLSRDEGGHWEGGLLLDERDCSYPFGFQARDGSIYVSYERQRWSKPEILFAHFTEDDVLNAKPGEETVLRQLINKAGG